jgi:hypothetical protein
MAEVDYHSAPTHPIALRTSGQSSNPAHVKPHADPVEYAKLYKESIEQPEQFWGRVSSIIISPLPVNKCWTIAICEFDFFSGYFESRKLVPAALQGD